MRGRFAWRKNRRDRGTYARGTKLVIGALQSVRGRFGHKRSKPQGRVYGDAVGLGIGVLVMVMIIALMFWLTRRLTRERTTATPEEGVEEAPPGNGTVPPEPPSA